VDEHVAPGGTFASAARQLVAAGDAAPPADCASPLVDRHVGVATLALTAVCVCLLLAVRLARLHGAWASRRQGGG
jgi:hypothetical protein